VNNPDTCLRTPGRASIMLMDPASVRAPFQLLPCSFHVAVGLVSYLHVVLRLPITSH
jgi:hypothetical protein